MQLKHSSKVASYVVIAITTLFMLSVLPRRACASCAAQAEDGKWKNTDPNTRSLTHIELRFICQDQILNGELYPPGSPWYVHVLGACLPSDCDWNEVGAQRNGTNHVFAFYDQGFAKRYVFARMSAYRPGQLWVWTWTDFQDPNRADYGTHNWFERE